jgi:hypothetical protein
VYSGTARNDKYFAVETSTAPPARVNCPQTEVAKSRHTPSVIVFVVILFMIDFPYLRIRLPPNASFNYPEIRRKTHKFTKINFFALIHMNSHENGAVLR